MSKELAQADPPVAEEAELVFEQPLTERMRTFLRIDFLYSQATYHNERASEWGSRAAVSSLIDILAITSRGDARADALKELERHLALLNEFQAKPHVDASRLRAVMANLVRLRTELLAAGSAYLQPVKDSEFLAAVKHRSAIPGGTCEFDLPDYYYWLRQPSQARTTAFNEWLELLRPLCDAIAELLWLTRQNGRSRQETAKGGVFHITFDRESPVQLLRISLPQSLGLYPEISGSHYRSSIRFLSWNGLGVRPTQSTDDIPFTLGCCN
ncbi:MAG: cell division protein ZapD [Steroidobacteraceae bacterium]